MRSTRLLLRTLLSGPLTGRRRPAECTGTAARWGEREGKSESGAMGTWGGGRVRKCVLLGERERGRAGATRKGGGDDGAAREEAAARRTVRGVEGQASGARAHLA